MMCAVERDLAAYYRQVDAEEARSFLEEGLAEELLNGSVWVGGVEFTVADVDAELAGSDAVARIEAIEARGASPETRERLAAAYVRLWHKAFDRLVSELADLAEVERESLLAEDAFDAGL
jgi:hypothetical protein